MLDPVSDHPTKEAAVLTGFAYLDISDPLVAWLVYRGEMISAQVGDWPAMSSWLARHLFSMDIGDSGAAQGLAAKTRLEAIRRRDYATAGSRLTSFFLFPDRESADEARDVWGFGERHRLVEVGLHPDARVSKYDSEWISLCLPAAGNFTWAGNYFGGLPHGSSPIWELVVEGRAYVYGTDVRTEAYEVVKRTWPESLALLEIARLGVELGSDIGHISAHPLAQPDGELRVDYFLDMRDAENPDFLARLKAFEGPKNAADLRPINEDVWFRVPDLRDYGFVLS